MRITRGREGSLAWRRSESTQVAHGSVLRQPSKAGGRKKSLKRRKRILLGQLARKRRGKTRLQKRGLRCRVSGSVTIYTLPLPKA